MMKQEGRSLGVSKIFLIGIVIALMMVLPTYSLTTINSNGNSIDKLIENEDQSKNLIEALQEIPNPETTDTTPPTVIATSPGLDLREVYLYSDIVVTFSEPMDQGIGNRGLRCALE